MEIPTISLTLRCPPENTMALGGVATGNMKANEQEMAAGSIIYQGWTWSSSAWKPTQMVVITANTIEIAVHGCQPATARVMLGFGVSTGSGVSTLVLAAFRLVTSLMQVAAMDSLTFKFKLILVFPISLK